MLIYRIIEKSISKVIDDEPFSTLFKKGTNYLSYLFFLKNSFNSSLFEYQFISLLNNCMYIEPFPPRFLRAVL